MPFSDFPEPKGSFQAPVDIPSGGPDEGSQVCVQFARNWLPYVLGCLKQLLLQATWNYTTVTELTDVQADATDLIAMFGNAIDSGACLVEPTFQQSDDCTLQVSYDGGVTWSTIFSALACATGAADNQIADGLLAGTLGNTTSQPAPVTPPAPTQCWNYHVTLDAKGKWLIPLPMTDGWSFTVQRAKGGANDGGLGPLWSCPEGTVYTLGNCGANNGTHSGDPIDTINHMRLIAEVGTTFVDAYNTSYTIPTGTGPVDVVFQVNDTELSDNNGSYDFELTVCNNTFVHVFDFSVNDGGFIVRTEFGGAEYIPGVEWRSVVLSGFSGTTVAIQKDVTFPSGTVMTKIEAIWGSEGSTGSSFKGLFYDGTFDNLAPTENGSGLFTMTDAPLAVSPTTRIGCQISVNIDGNHCSVKKITVYGNGPDPF